MAAMADYLLLPAIGKQYQPIPIKPDFFCSPTGFIPIRQTLLFPINDAYQSVSRSAVDEILWMERSAPLNSSSASRRRPNSFFSVP